MLREKSSPSPGNMHKTMMKIMNLSDIRHHPPQRAGRSQTLSEDEIIASSGAQVPRRAKKGITLGQRGSSHQPGWDLWLL
nr:hypothetical protein CFP56_11823 [Quercus suber]